MKQKAKREWGFDVAFLAVWLILLSSLAVLFFADRRFFWILLGLTVAAAALSLYRFSRRRYLYSRYLGRLSRHLRQVNAEDLENSPFPVITISETGEVMWYNRLFRDNVLRKKDRIGDSSASLLGGHTPETLVKNDSLDVEIGGSQYTVLHKVVPVRETRLYVLYYWENTELKETAEEYKQSRPVVLSIYIDNLDELAQGARDSERARIAGSVETILEDWIGSTSGFLRKYDSGRFLAFIEQRHLDRMLADKFSVLDRVRAEKVDDITGITLSIGVGRGADFRSAETEARQALEMALGRGGDQVAMRTPNGYDFYGGVSRGVERRTKVRTRVIAAALKELIEGSEIVLTMGHLFSDLDCLGSAITMAMIAREMGKPAYVAINRDTTLAAELLERYDEEQTDLFIDEETALSLINGKTLLIVTDTHSENRLEFPSVYRAAEHVVVIDHHRKMVGYIENALIFYHEPYASSASEMVTELAQYMSVKGLSRMEAESLLAGIVLDTRSFSMKAGVRTFEAAAYLRKQGADTVSVKKMFAGNMNLYRLKAEIMSKAETYKNTAFACIESSGAGVRIAASQAADELLSIKGVEASFSLFSENGGINLSARSYGDFNVQLVMEALGGGGHQAMAGAFLAGASMEEAKMRLKEAVDRYLTDVGRSLPARSLDMG